MTMRFFNGIIYLLAGIIIAALYLMMVPLGVFLAARRWWVCREAVVNALDCPPCIYGPGGEFVERHTPTIDKQA